MLMVDGLELSSNDLSNYLKNLGGEIDTFIKETVRPIIEDIITTIEMEFLNDVSYYVDEVDDNMVWEMASRDEYDIDGNIQ